MENYKITKVGNLIHWKFLNLKIEKWKKLITENLIFFIQFVKLQKLEMENYKIGRMGNLKLWTLKNWKFKNGNN